MHAEKESPWVLVAGGSGGIGASIARTSAADGWNLAVTYRNNQEKADEVVQSVREMGGKGESFHVDLADASDVGTLLRSVAEMGALEGVVYASGPHIIMRYVSEQSPETFAESMNADANAFFNLVHHSLPHLRKNGGSLVALTTPAIRRFAKRDILSTAPKAAVQAVVRGVAVEEGRYGVRANCVAVGLLEGEGMWNELLARGDYSEEMLEVAKRNTPLQRFGDVQDVAEAVCYLLSTRAGWVTGQTLAVDGGYST